MRWEEGCISRELYEQRNAHKGAVVWFTGFSGSGKSTLAKAVLHRLFNDGKQVTILDGDNVRHGLCGDLNFSAEDRTENIRRVGEVAKLFCDSGMIVLCTFISPFRADRDQVRTILPQGSFCEVHINCDIEVCKSRDPKGLYAKALSGEIGEFTGISSPYETPQNPEVVVRTDEQSVDECAQAIINYLGEQQVL